MRRCGLLASSGFLEGLFLAREVCRAERLEARQTRHVGRHRHQNRRKHDKHHDDEREQQKPHTIDIVLGCQQFKAASGCNPTTALKRQYERDVRPLASAASSQFGAGWVRGVMLRDHTRRPALGCGCAHAVEVAPNLAPVPCGLRILG